ncbi:GrpB family protein [Lentzea sp. NPDC092896]|uniref:GrpB family protein n=1 Tax=Lentzea sp. NPDC092896 TaxID=3364127 RepID=UPI003810A82D
MIEIVDHDPGWRDWFTRQGGALRTALGPVAVRIDHIGSTAVPGLAAKPYLDVQVSVASFHPLALYRDPLERLGLRFRADNPELTKRYFREQDGTPRVHVHVRRAGSFSEQLPLLMRDFLREDDASVREYEAVKREIADRCADVPQLYAEEKQPFVWTLVARADAWAQRIGWEPGPSDA